MQLHEEECFMIISGTSVSFTKNFKFNTSAEKFYMNFNMISPKDKLDGYTPWEKDI